MSGVNEQPMLNIPGGDQATAEKTVAKTETAPKKSSEAAPAIDLDTFLRMVVAQGVSDIHLRVGYPPMLRKDGDMMTTKLPQLTPDDVISFAKKVIPPKILNMVRNRREYDFGFDFDASARFRVNLFYEMNRPAMVLRVIPCRIPTLDDIGLPNYVKRFTELNKGLVLVTGPTGAGKTTTLASILNHINHNFQKHIITLEDPVEYVYHNAKAVFTQRELGVDTDSFPNGLKYALRQDPDVILIGEMRDRETISSALHAAETGHLVFSTLHTTDAIQTINRIINIYEPHEREPVRKQLAAVLQGTVSQRLVRRAEGKGRIAVAEMMTVTPAVRDYIARNEMDEVYQLLQTGEFDGMCSLNIALYRTYRNNLIKGEDALVVSDNPTELQQMFRGAFHGSG
ncbi:MAG: PilT/PilU family type 4a pilus ATPase [Cyanobacteria bacterium]|nr:PilT/PilU family type 4a pilus ATPase [Cyanobacteriota bacterium]